MLVRKKKKNVRSFVLEWITKIFLGICHLSMSTKLRCRAGNFPECFMASVITLKICVIHMLPHGCWGNSIPFNN